MNVAEYVVKFLVSKGVGDVFGIPGGVILDLLYALEATPGIEAHLSSHEQGAVLEACGYAQAESSLGVAYCTRGPGVTNAVTGIAEAFSESVPIMVLTSHANRIQNPGMRFEFDQELDSVPLVANITKYAVQIEDPEDVCRELEYAWQQAVTGRKGPVLLDFASALWKREVTITDTDIAAEDPDGTVVYTNTVNYVMERLEKVKRPVILAGDGLRQAGACRYIRELAERLRIPVISSRGAQDVISGFPLYYGYIGSHGIRYSNFILEKSDFILSLGNRMSFPPASESFRSAIENKCVIRLDIDEREFEREIPGAINFTVEISAFLKEFLKHRKNQSFEEWISVCDRLKKELRDKDLNEAVYKITQIFQSMSSDILIVSDVGNNEFWVSRAYEYSGICNRILYSKSFGTLGCAIGKAIGACYYTQRPVLCIVGDQGIQLNIQELQMIRQAQLPVLILIVNNHSSGMIRSRERVKYNARYVHTTPDSGYGHPEFEFIARAYNIPYYTWSDFEKKLVEEEIREWTGPGMIELEVDMEVDLQPGLPLGNTCQNLEPALPEEQYAFLDQL